MAVAARLVERRVAALVNAVDLNAILRQHPLELLRLADDRGPVQRFAVEDRALLLVGVGSVGHVLGERDGLDGGAVLDPLQHLGELVYVLGIEAQWIEALGELVLVLAAALARLLEEVAARLEDLVARGAGAGSEGGLAGGRHLGCGCGAYLRQRRAAEVD